MAVERQLGLASATALVVASMIGTGVFTTSGFLLADLNSPGMVLAAWLAGGIIAALGALSYGALARRIPESGGEYIFLSRTVHPAAGFLAGWISLLVGFSAPLAAVAFSFGKYTQTWWPTLEPKSAGALLLLLFSLIHATHVRRGVWVQNLAVLVKLSLIAAFVFLGATRLTAAPPNFFGHAPVSHFAVSLVWISFSYSGWNAPIYVGGEVRNPERTLPLAMLIGTLLVTVVYLALNSVFLMAAPPDTLRGKLEIGRIAAQALGGRLWSEGVTGVICIALVTSVSSMIMAGPRVYSRMAEDSCLPKTFAQPHGPPRAAIGFQLAVALFLLWTATFESLLTYIGFTLGLSTAMTVFGLIRLRAKEGPALRVIGWPWVPVLFLLSVSLMTFFSIWQRPIESAAVLGTLAAGAIVWRFTSGPQVSARQS